ncbi:hypothetical protein [Fructilactobacillus cliffordii]|uniref:Uncharacterized protein n=1 Tax=Fructilactobacillus cliffordii TaxID=2940299 RepID=A0A9Q8ZNZ0_9LACO|nr:hypothetical protein [Fructilactobacillus cliffordii]USS85846.1 hypothetical protein M3M38_03825 [Fructilactobacillus cliffordii]USS88915.1 hypothetical protein M3M40_05360 [Fructilactobacillus cliffordii]
MKQDEIDQRLIKLRRIANWTITPLCLALIVAYFVQKEVTPLVIILAILVVCAYIPYGAVTLYYVWKRRKQN